MKRFCNSYRMNNVTFRWLVRFTRLNSIKSKLIIPYITPSHDYALFKAAIKNTFNKNRYLKSIAHNYV